MQINLLLEKVFNIFPTLQIMPIFVLLLYISIVPTNRYET